MTKGYTGIQQNYAWGQDSWRDFDLTLQQILPSAKASENVQFPKIFAGQYGSEISAMSLDKADLFIRVFGAETLRPLFSKVAARGLFKEKTGVFTVGGTAAYRLGQETAERTCLGSAWALRDLVRDRDTVT